MKCIFRNNFLFAFLTFLILSLGYFFFPVSALVSSGQNQPRHATPAAFQPIHHYGIPYFGTEKRTRVYEDRLFVPNLRGYFWRSPHALFWVWSQVLLPLYTRQIENCKPVPRLSTPPRTQGLEEVPQTWGTFERVSNHEHGVHKTAFPHTDDGAPGQANAN